MGSGLLRLFAASAATVPRDPAPLFNPTFRRQKDKVLASAIPASISKPAEGSGTALSKVRPSATSAGSKLSATTVIIDPAPNPSYMKLSRWKLADDVV